MKKLRAAVIGAGRMGSLHSRIYSQMKQVDLTWIVDVSLEKAQELAKKFGGTPSRDPNEIIDTVDVVTIAVPTEFHVEVAEPFLRRSKAVLVEKPLASTLPEARHLLELARKNNCTLQVGYSERFNPVAQAMRDLNIIPRYMESHRVSPFTFRSTDVGVVLDMMIHDIDIMLSFAQSPVKDIQAVGVNVLGAHEDIANVRLTFENGCIANLTASRLAMKTERRVRIFNEDAYLSLDFLQKTGIMIRKDDNIDMFKMIRQRLGPNNDMDLKDMDWTDLVRIETLEIDDREPLQLEQEAFVQAAIDGKPPQVSAQDAVAAMELADRIVNAIQQHQWEGKDSSLLTQAGA
ncbi:MAG: Gfo/Idh/MocA family oxidoreductase [Planctomycetes bacterium]|nr:Gfo/Idh/MocA family oxidoreductase [Planctomycetota bacterium]